MESSFIDHVLVSRGNTPIPSVKDLMPISHETRPAAGYVKYGCTVKMISLEIND
jgi:hypothetical protein